MKLPRLSPHLRIALLYALFGGAWILVSDWLLSTLARDPAVVAHMQTYKGWFFVAASALLILVLLHRELTLRQNTEEELRQSEERFRSAFDNMLEGAQILSHDWRYLYLNPSAEIHNRRPNRELLGKRYMDMWPGIIDTPVFVEIKRCMDEGAPSQMENRFVYPDGAVGWFNLSLQPVPEGILVLSLDITERNQAEEALKESEERFSTAFFTSPVSQSIITQESNEILAVNDACCRLFGYSREELIGNNTAKLNLWENPADRLAAVEELQKTGRLLPQEATIWVRSGEIRTVIVAIEPISWKGLPCLISSISDITERKQAEQTIIERERQMAALVTSLDDIVFELDERGTYLNVWAADESKLAQPKALVIGQRMDDVLGEEISHPLTEAVRRTIVEGRTEIIEYPLQVIKGPRWFMAHVNPIVAPDGSHRTASVLVRDITERKQAEEKIVELQEFSQATIDALSAHLCVLDENGVIISINQAWRAFAEANPPTPADHFLRINYLSVCDNAHGKDSEEAAAVAQGIRAVMDGSLERFQSEYPCHAPQEERWFIVQVTRFYQNGVVRIAVAHENITGRKQAEDKIRQQLNRMSALRAIDRAISASMDMRMSLEILLGEVLSQLGVDAVAVLLLNPTDPMLEYFAGKGFRTPAINQTRIRLGEGFAGQVGMERKVIHVPDLARVMDQFKRASLLKDEEFVAYFGVPLIAKGMLKGVLEIFHRTPLESDQEWENYLEMLGGQAAIAIDNAQLFDGVQRSNLELFAAYDATIEGWSRAMDLRDKETEGHTQRVTRLTMQLAEKMGLGRQELLHIRRGALLHDIGKLGVPDHILLKPGKLTEQEWALMKQHPAFAFEMLKPIQYLQPALDIPYCHHEKWDGSGYPRGLAGEQIPIAARIFAIVDVYDALTSDRPYRDGWSKEATIEHIRSERGKHFDPKVVDAFLVHVN